MNWYSPLKVMPLFSSVLVFIALLFLTEAGSKNYFTLSKSLHATLIIFLSIFLFLLSSKLVIGFYFLYLVIYFKGFLKNSPVNRLLIIGSMALFIAGAVIVLATKNPVSNRFYDVIKGDLKVVKMEKFHPGMYFNGVQFRLLQWRFTAEILNENHSWWTGVGPGRSLQYLDKKYISTNMYIGEPARGDSGFLALNAHNQFLETLLQIGIFGLVALLFVCFTLVKMSWQRKKGK